MKNIEFNEERARRYSKAMKEFPFVRNSELMNLKLDRCISRPSMRILDLGAGDGFLTNYLSKRFKKAKIFAIDISKSMLSNFPKEGILTYTRASSHSLPFNDEFFDMVISLASFHHIIKKKETFEEIKRVLIPNGVFIIADVRDKTKTQLFFDTIVKKYCITGHEFSFLNEKKVRELANNSGLFLKESKLKNTPWKFKSREGMAYFIKNLLGLDMSEDLLLKILFEHFHISIKSSGIKLLWQLGYHLLIKSEKTRRIQKSPFMSLKEKKDFSKIITKMPWLYKPILGGIKRYASKSSTLIDVGGGDGFLLKLINSKFPKLKLIGLDTDSYFINKARRKYSFDFFVDDGQTTRRTADIITCNLMLHHAKNPKKLIKNLYKNSNKALIVSDQIRPLYSIELSKRLEIRKKFIGEFDVPFYTENERRSILESYSKEEVEDMFSLIGTPFYIKFFDNDYYKRFVAIFPRSSTDKKFKSF